MRLFVAIWPTDDVQRAIGAAAASVRRSGDGIAWVPNENLHVTVKFLGDVDESRIPEIGIALDEACRRVATFDAATGQGGAFPDIGNPRVLFAAIERGGPEVALLAGKVETAMEAIGFKREERPFHGHVTVGRVRDSRRGVDAAARFLAAKLPEHSIPVSSLVLVRSTRTPEDLSYAPLTEHPFVD